MWSILLHLFSGYVFRSCIMKGQKVKSFVFCFTCDFFDFNRTLPSLICPVTSKLRKSEVQGHKFKGHVMCIRISWILFMAKPTNVY